MDQGVPVSVRVVEEVAERNAVDPTELEPRLHDVLDPDALDSLVEFDGGTTEPAATVEFQYAGCAVAVESSGEIRVSEPNTAAEPQAGRPTETSGD